MRWYIGRYVDAGKSIIGENALNALPVDSKHFSAIRQRGRSMIGDGTVPVYPVARLTIAMAPWFGSCKQCRRELGLNGPELVAKLVADDDTNFNFQCVDCLTAFVKADAIRQMEDTPASNSTDSDNSGIVKP